MPSATAPTLGIVYVDYLTQARIPKTSAAWYKRVIAANAVVEPEDWKQHS